MTRFGSSRDRTMALIFPGMDPYLEEPALWPGVHAALIVYARDHLQPQVRPRYIAAIEERVYLEGPDRPIIPDVRLQQHRPAAPGPGARADPGGPRKLRDHPRPAVGSARGHRDRGGQPHQQVRRAGPQLVPG